MATIELQQVEKKFGEFYAVKPMDLTVQDGEFVVLLGPSGCGKTTTLRMISGLETVTSGTILLDGRNVTWRHPSDRDISFVFQFFALYPHMSAMQNIIFPLQAEGLDKDEIQRRLRDVVDLLRIRHLLNSRPGKLSGGDKQRVALARALVRDPAAFLMDEPLGALDAEFREAMRAEIRRLHISQGATTVYVTHDQIEAMAMGDKIVVMSAAEIQQVGTPAEVYYDPSNLFVAQFIGSPGMNLIDGQFEGSHTVKLPGDNLLTVADGWAGALKQALNGAGKVILGFRPEAALLSDEGTLAGEVYASDMHGAFTMLHVSMGSEGHIVHIRGERLLRYPIGTIVKIDLEPTMIRFFNSTSELAIRKEMN
jgi:multiple sugar transport system ATP-binding protein